ncbi:MAG: glycosyltransferase family 4 protein [Tannerella sp.]|jgi:glycosyltransferase involved in cell wall biosynthesis|nr:glycosyltransferase family 4 protein [Tannerella sp.]
MNKINKILVLHTSAAVGGAEYSLLEFLNNLKGFPIEVHIALSLQIEKLFRDRVEIPVQFHPFELSYFRKYHDLKSYFQAFISLALHNYRILKLVKKQKIQTVYCNTFRTVPYCFAVKLFGKTQVVCHCRDNISSKLTQYLIKKGSDKVIAVSAAIKNQLSPHVDVKVIYNGVNVTSFSDTKPTKWFHKERNLSPDIQLIGNIGQIVSWKNQTDYVLIAKELIKKNVNLHFLLIGNPVDNRYFSLLKQQINAFHLDTCFTLTGPVEDIKKYMGELDILLHTAIHEPFGRVIIEAAAASIPVVAYDSGGLSEIILPGETGFLIQNRDIHQMAEQTFLLLNNPSLRASIGKSAQRHIAKNFNSIDCANKLCNALLYD